MKVKDIVLATSMYLGREDVITFFEDPESFVTERSNVLSMIDNLTRCINLVVNELATTYLPLIKEEQVNTTNCKIRYDSLQERATEIVEIFNDYGKKVNFKVFSEYVEVYESSVKICYKYIPSNLGLEDEVGYDESKVPVRLLAYATASELCLIEKGYQESLMWRNRFCDSLANIIAPHNYKIKERRFI